MEIIKYTHSSKSLHLLLSYIRYNLYFYIFAFSTPSIPSFYLLDVLCDPTTPFGRKGPI